MKKTMSLAAMVAAAALLSAPAFANHGGFGHEGHGYGKSCEAGGPITGKILWKSGFLLKHKTDLALTEEQVKTIEAINLEAEKGAARQKADRKIFMLDLKSKLSAETVDVAGADALIDQGFASMAASAKSSVQAYAKLKAVLTPDQLAKMKELHRGRKQESKEAPQGQTGA